MNKNPEVTILMSAYNEEKYIKKTIDSLLNQTYKNVKFVIINDGSTDNTSNILNEYEKKYPDKIKFINNKRNVGLTRCLNIGLSFCDGEYIARADANDHYDPTRLEKQVKFLEAHSEHAVVGTWRIEYWPEDLSRGNRIVKLPETDKEIRASIIKGGCVGHSTTMIRASVLKDLQYNEYFKQSQDNELWGRILKDYKMHNIPEHLTTIGRIPGSVTDTKKIFSRLNYQLRIRYQIYKNVGYPKWYILYLIKPIIEVLAPKKLIEWYINMKPGVKNE